MDLFSSEPIAQPLAARLRATNLDEYVGQQHLLAHGKPLREALEQGALHSMIFWGPPGVGKTTLARLLRVEACSLTIPANVAQGGSHGGVALVPRGADGVEALSALLQLA